MGGYEDQKFLSQSHAVQRFAFASCGSFHGARDVLLDGEVGHHDVLEDHCDRRFPPEVLDRGRWEGVEDPNASRPGVPDPFGVWVCP